ncbi:RAMP superfamily CRISPR-associated protein [Rhodococcus opacus]|uniref:RAMP superfamily CRISPR-associated protein n=1 Tax=Rhodococcus opacus TaxID=37919 RepID=UPI001C497B11|nr:RAMP superfamily CRISPR-associated protein [Rhodococcus opacus]MBV6760553.1 hypothetical protein [Rhodococcus opacus]
MTTTVHWDLAISALSSISHKDDDTSTTTALFRREPVIQPDGTEELVPIVSGNSFRGALRRTGEELLRDVLDYEGILSLPAAHTLRSGGALRKINGEPISGRRLERLRTLIPQIGVFGGNTTGTMVKGRLQVGKVVPKVRETAHILRNPGGAPLPGQFDLLGLERYSRFDDADSGDFPTPRAPDSSSGTQLMRYEIETLPAGTQFESWLRLTRGTDQEVAFFQDVLDTFAADGRIGGRQAIGHGLIKLESDRKVVAGPSPLDCDWRERVRDVRGEALDMLAGLT